MRGTRRRSVVMVVFGAALAVGGCTPEPVPAPRWVTTRAARVATPEAVTNVVGGWTDDEWAAALEVTSITGGGGSATIDFFPRSGPGNSTLGTPQRLTTTVGPGFAGPIGEHIVALGGATAVEFFRETAGVWASAGTFALPADQQLLALTDDWMVLRHLPMSPGTENVVNVYALDASGPTVEATHNTTLHPDPTWPIELRESFGSQVAAVDGEVMAVGARGLFNPAPAGLVIFRLVAGTWVPAQSLGASPGGPGDLGSVISVDDGATVDRVAFNATTGGLGSVEVWSDAGAGFAHEQTLTLDPGDVDVYNGALFGQSLSLDGALLAITARGVTVPSADVGHDDVTVGYVQLFRKAASWLREAEVGVFPTPAPAGTRSMLPWKLQAAGNHVAVSALVSPDPPPGCSFPCFVFGFEAWSIDRTG